MNNFVVGVCSRSFSSNATLCNELKAHFPDVKLNEDGVSLEGDGLIEFLSDCDAAIVGLESIDESIISCLPRLRIISKYGVGTDKICFESLRKFGVVFSVERGVNAGSVAELALGLILSSIRGINASISEVKNGLWVNRKGKCLANRTVGIIGLGNVGSKLVDLLRPFNCELLANDICGEIIAEGVEFTTLHDLLIRSEIISLHVPLDTTTENLLGRHEIGLMRRNSLLVNTSRGGVVDESAFVEAMDNKSLYGAFDVFDVEPPRNLALVGHPNMLATAHIGGSSHEAIIEMGRAAIRGLVKNSGL